MLTQEQMFAAECVWPQVGVLAGAGSGKTQTLVARVKRLIAGGCTPGDIAVFTFTRLAADELRARLGKAGERCLIGTYHHVAYQLMDRKPYVFDEAAADALLMKSCACIGGSLSYWRKAVTEYRNRLAVGEPVGMDGVRGVADNYLSWLKMDGAIDFHGLLLDLLARSNSMSLSHIIVDEAQDNEPIQWDIVDNLMRNGARGYFVGDISQSIYGWRGALPEHFVMHSLNQLQLTQTFRLPMDVCALANTIAEKNDPSALLLRTERTECGLTVERDEPEEVVRGLINDEMFSESDIAVLTRTNNSVEEITQSLRAAGIQVAAPMVERSGYIHILRHLMQPHTPIPAEVLAQITEPKFLTEARSPLRDAKVRLWLGKQDGTVRGAIQAIKFDVPEYEDEKDWLNNYFGTLSILDGVNEVSLSASEVRRTPGVTVCTAHQAKGLEFPAVVVASSPYNYCGEALRVRYVMVTRAKERCVILDSDTQLVQDALRAGAIDARKQFATPF